MYSCKYCRQVQKAGWSFHWCQAVQQMLWREDIVTDAKYFRRAYSIKL